MLNLLLFLILTHLWEWENWGGKSSILIVKSKCTFINISRRLISWEFLSSHILSLYCSLSWSTFQSVLLLNVFHHLFKDQVSHRRVFSLRKLWFKPVNTFFTPSCSFKISSFSGSTFFSRKIYCRSRQFETSDSHWGKRCFKLFWVAVPAPYGTEMILKQQNSPGVLYGLISESWNETLSKALRLTQVCDKYVDM